MTTVVCNRKYMVSDSMACAGSTKSQADKLFRGPGGTVIGVAGAYSKCLQMVDFICGRVETPPELGDDDVFVLHLRHDGIWVYEDNTRPFRMKQDAWAIGSGNQFALGALHMGATPEQAVAAAIKYDLYSGGRAKMMLLETGS